MVWDAPGSPKVSERLQPPRPLRVRIEGQRGSLLCSHRVVLLHLVDEEKERATGVAFEPAQRPRPEHSEAPAVLLDEAIEAPVESPIGANVPPVHEGLGSVAAFAQKLGECRDPGRQRSQFAHTRVVRLTVGNLLAARVRTVHSAAG